MKRSVIRYAAAGLLWWYAVCGVFAQTPPPKLWDRSVGGTETDIVQSAIEAPDGSFVLAAISNSPASGTKSTPNYGDLDAWVVKMNPAGTKVWETNIGGSAKETVRKIIQFSGGGYLVVGSSNSGINGNKSAVVYGNTDGWVIRLDENGSKVWDKSYGGSNIDEFEDAVATPDGGYLLFGSSQSPVSGNKTGVAYGGSDFWLVKIDSAGNKLWDKTYGGSSMESGYGLAALPSGGYVLVGSSGSQPGGNKTAALIGGFEDLWAVRVDNTGNKIWDESYGGTGYDMGFRVVANTAGIFIAGVSESAPTGVTKTAIVHGGSDFWLLKLDAFGTRIWDKSYGGTADESAFDIVPVSSGFLLSGYSISVPSGNKIAPKWGGTDAWVVLTDANGNKLWDESYGGTGISDQRLYQSIMLSNGDFLATGYSNAGQTGNKTAVAYGNRDGWYIRISGCPATLPITVQSSATGVVCPQSAVTLTASPATGFTYSWQPGNLSGASVSVNPAQSTVYTLTATNAGGCSATQTLAVQVAQNTPIVDSLFMNFGDTLFLSPPPGQSYLWLPTGETTPSIAIQHPGWHAVEVKYGNCSQVYEYYVDTLAVLAGVSGRVYFDVNQNGQLELGDAPVVNHPVFLLTPGGQLLATTTTDVSGFYWFAWPAAGTYVVKVQLIGGQSPILQPNAQGQYTESVSGVGQVVANRDFAFKAYRDLSVTATQLTPFRPGFPWRVRVQYCNKGQITEFSGTVSVVVSPSVLNAGSTVSQAFTNLQPGECRTFDVIGTVPPTLPLGTPVSITATVPTANDDKPSNNLSKVQATVQGAYDPNDKGAFIEARMTGEYALEGDTIEYLIRFQNTGTDTAFTVIVRDTLDHTQLDLTTLEVLATSHAARFTLRGLGIGVWEFRNILLPDSNTNEPLSHGFIRFRVKTRTNLGCDALTSNRVAIYFDFNDPVITNDAITELNPTPVPEIVVSDEGNRTATFTAQATPFAETLTWDFGSDASPATATGTGPHQVSYSTDGSKTIRLTAATLPLCRADASTTVKFETTARSAHPESAFTLAPNPTTGQLMLTFNQPVSGTIQVLDAVGRVVLNQPLSQTTTSVLDLTGQPAGVYWVQALGQTTKVVLIR